MRFLSMVLASAVTALAGGAPPTAPSLTFLYTVNITFPAAISISPTRDAIPITGGTFSGPKLNGKVLPIGADFFGVDASGNCRPNTAYVLQTHDGANILYRAKGHCPYEYASFETGNNSYSWLNSVVAVAEGNLITGGVSLNVWQFG